MKQLNSLANDMIYGDIVKRIAETRNISLTEARTIVSEMSFKEYFAEAAITPPSGNTIGPTTQSTNTAAQAGGAGGAKAIWPGKGAPVQVGMTVGSKGPNGLPVPGTVSQVDTGAKGVKVKNPTTGTEQWMDIETLQPFMAAAGGQGGQAQSQTAQQSAMDQVGKLAEENELTRMLQLAGIQENCSGGATGAGAIAMSPSAMGGVKKRQPAEEALTREYTPKEPAKTIVGDTKPNQASGKLSADLAASGKSVASRINNGRKRSR